ncbi:MAG: hypothetical protein DHS20C16_01060 [Phycisphaerae bacterium]|nr:MAG: hypothetical protein DHS20C16_01060 [Phycisphaerae bacterium]
MKKVVITVVVMVVLFLGYRQLSNTQLNLKFLQEKTAIVGSGDLTIPITGTGEIHPKSRSVIKPEASGEVIEIPVAPGQLVKAKDLLIRLDQEEEQRNVTRAKNEVARASATLEQQKLRLKERKTSAIAQIDARIKGIEAQLVDAKFTFDKTKRLQEKIFEGRKRDLASMDELTTVQARYEQLEAQFDGAIADRTQAEIAIGLTERDVELAEKAHEIAETNLSDAEKRLRETEIRSPIDGMVSKINVSVGAVVQGGKTTFTGGTELAVVSDISDMYVRTEVSDADIGAVMWLAPPRARPGGLELAQKLADDDVVPLVSTNSLVPELGMEGVPVSVMVDSFRDQEFEGIIESIDPEPRKAQNIVTYIVHIRVTSKNHMMLALVPGMQADVEFTAEAVTDATLIPHDAIHRGPNDDLGVYVREVDPETKEAKPRFVSCRFGLDNGLYAELIEGEGIVKGVVVYTKLPQRFGKDDDEDE